MVRPQQRQNVRRLASLGVGVLVALLLGEGVARIGGLERRWLPSLAYYQGVDVELHRPSFDVDLLYELRPGVERLVPAGAGGVVEAETAWWSDPRVVRTNSFGHRGPDRSATKPPGTFRILGLGGSNTFGAAVSNGESWPGALERALVGRSDRAIEVWNLGVNGYVTSQKLAQAKAAVARFDPDLLLFQIYNTGPRNVLLDEHVDVVQTFHEDPRLYRETLLWSPSASQGMLSLLWSSSHLIRTVVIALNRRARVDAQGKYGAPLEALDNRSELQAERLFQEFVEEMAGRTPIWILYGAEGPGPEWCERAGVPVIQLDREPDIPDLPGARHIHPGAEVYAWYGEKIADHLIAAGCLDEGC